MKGGYPFHNTVFSVPDLPVKFYQVNVGDKRAVVEQLIGKPFYTRDGYTGYSTPGNELFWSNFNVVFQVKYNADTVVEKRVIQDD